MVRKGLHALNLLVLSAPGTGAGGTCVGQGEQGTRAASQLLPRPLAFRNSTAVKLLVAKDSLQSSEALTPRIHLLSSSNLSFNNAANIISHLRLVRSVLCLAGLFVSPRHLVPSRPNGKRLWLLKLITYVTA